MALNASSVRFGAALGSGYTRLAGSIAGSAGSWIARNGSGQNAVNSALSENNASGMLDTIQQNRDYNNQWSASQADQLRKWQEQQTQKAMDFNAEQAALNRAWQETMSNTAHQREIRDLKAAGLNPVLSAMGGNGAAVGSGATASVTVPSGAKGEADTSANSALVSVLGSMLSAQTQLEAQRISAETLRETNELTNATSQLIARIQGEYGLQQAHIHGQYGVTQSGISAQAARDAAATSAYGTMYSADQARRSSAYTNFANILNTGRTTATSRENVESTNRVTKFLGLLNSATSVLNSSRNIGGGIAGALR